MTREELVKEVLADLNVAQVKIAEAQKKCEMVDRHEYYCYLQEAHGRVGDVITRLEVGMKRLNYQDK